MSPEFLYKIPKDQLKKPGALIIDKITPSEDSEGFQIHFRIDPSRPTISEDMKNSLLENAPTYNDRKKLEKIINRINGIDS